MHKLSIFCTAPGSHYEKFPELDLWPIERDAYNFTGNNRVIAHPPCAQWSRMRSFAKVNQYEKDLAFFCLEKVQKNGGILEHPAGSSFFKAAGIKPTCSVNQHWFGYPAQKRTYLYFVDCLPLPVPLNFSHPTMTVMQMDKDKRSLMTFDFCVWLILSSQYQEFRKCITSRTNSNE